MVTRIIVGAHYGWKDWLVQRTTAVIMALYTLLLLGIALYQGGIDHASWIALFAHPGFRIATLLFGLALLWHAWIGMRPLAANWPTGWRIDLFRENARGTILLTQVRCDYSPSSWGASCPIRRVRCPHRPIWAGRSR